MTLKRTHTLSSNPGFPDRVKGGARIFKSVGDILKNTQNQLWSSFRRKFGSRPVPRALIPTFPIHTVIDLLPIWCVKAFLNNTDHLHAGCARRSSGSSAGGSGTVREEVGARVCPRVLKGEEESVFVPAL